VQPRRRAQQQRQPAHAPPAPASLSPRRQAGVITDLVLLWTVGIRPVLVHGGGPEINSWLTKLGIEPEFKNGLRVTDGAARGARLEGVAGAQRPRRDGAAAADSGRGRRRARRARGSWPPDRPHPHAPRPPPPRPPSSLPGPTMEVVEMVLGGRVNKSLVSLIEQAGGKAVGLCGKDGNLLRARQMVEKDIG
jgi:hypothetical protein